MISRPLFILSIAVGLLAGCTTQNQNPPRLQTQSVKTGFSKQANVVYTPNGWPRALPANLYVPKGTGPWPAVLLIYGGSWNEKDHRWQMNLLARKLAGRGYVVMNAAYRGAPEFPYPAAIDDMSEAVRWLRTHAPEYNVRSDRIAAYGFSAGGHLAALLGTRSAPPESRVQAVVVMSAPTDFLLFQPEGPAINRFMGGSAKEKPALYREASPVYQVTPDDPPFWIYHGTEDKTVDPEHSRVLKAALDRVGVRNELRWIEGKGHASMLVFNGEAEAAAIDFLDSVLR